MFDLRPLRSGGFRHLAAAYWVNEFGNWIGEIALTILIYDRTHSPLVTAGLFLTLRFAPALLAPLLTTRIEALHVRVVLTMLYALEAVLFAVIAVVATHSFSMPAILVLAALDGMLAITAKTLTRSATASGLLEQGLLREGNAIINLGWMVSTACSPVIAGALVAWKGAESALLVDAGTFLVTALIVAAASGIRVESDREAGFAGRTRNGLAVLRTRRSVRRLMVALALVMLLSAVPLPIEIVFVKHTLHAGDSGYGLLLGSWGFGMVVGAAVFAAGGGVRLPAVFGVGMVVVALGYGVLAAAPSLAIACVGSAIGGVGNGAGWVAAVTALQERVPLNTQSAVLAVMEGLNQLMPAVGFAVGGVVTALSSPRVAYAISAAGVALVMLVFTIRPIDQIRLQPVARESGAPPLAPPAPDAQERAAREQPDAQELAQESEHLDRSIPIPTLTIG